jgi:hypothetical protein
MSTSSMPPLISLPIVKPPRQPDRTRRTVTLRVGRPKARPAQFHPDLSATAYRTRDPHVRLSEQGGKRRGFESSPFTQQGDEGEGSSPHQHTSSPPQ